METIKKPANAYMIFKMEYKDKWKLENNGSTKGLTYVTQGELWKNMTEAQQAPYYELHKLDKIRYEKDMEAAGL